MNFFRTASLFFLFSVLYSTIDIHQSYAQSYAPQCHTSSPLLEFITLKIQQSSLSIVQSLPCVDYKKLSSTNPSLIELTTGRKQGNAVICLGTSREYPCQYVVGIFKEGTDPTSALASIFSVQQRDPNAPLNETVERLFIRPAALIR